MENDNSLSQSRLAEESLLISAVRTLEKEGKQSAARKYQRSFFDVSETPAFMKDLGLFGEKFTIPYGAISRHFGKDEDHELTEEEWCSLSEAVQTPFAITKYYTDRSRQCQRGYRIYTSIPKRNGYIVLGVDLKRINQGKGRPFRLINSITTIFGKDGNITESEEIIYRSEKINPRQASLLERPNSSQYPLAEDFNCKDI